MSELALSIVIPTCGKSHTLSRLLASLKCQVFEGTYEIFFVENLAGDLSQAQRSEILQNPKCTILTAGRRGANAARNLGLDRARGSVVLFLDDDCEAPHPNYFQAVVLAHQKFPEVCALGGLYLDPPNLKGVSKVYQDLARHWLETRRSLTGEQLQLVGGCVSYKRSQLAEQGLKFDPNIEFGGTETDLHERMTLKNLSLRLERSLSNTHHCDITTLSFLRKAFLQGLGHAQRAATRPKVQVRPSVDVPRPKGFLVLLYDLAFFSGKYWSSGQNGYHYPTDRQIFTKILAELPGFALPLMGLDREALYWRWRKISSSTFLWFNARYWTLIQLKGDLRDRLVAPYLYWKPRDIILRGLAFLRWKPRALLAQMRGQLIALRWRLINLRHDMIFALLGYGNHRVFERFELRPLPPPKYFQAEQVVRLNSQDLESLDDVTLDALTLRGQIAIVQLGETSLNSAMLTKFVQLQSRLHGVILTLTQEFDFRRVLPLWKSLKIPVFLEAEARAENLDAAYDHIKDIFYMGQSKDPKAIYSSCIKTTAPVAGPIEKSLRTRFSEQTPRYSFIIPIYNNADYIGKVLEHLEAQNGAREDWEIIAIDDGSQECVVTLIEAWLNTRPTMNLTALRWSRTLPDGTRDESFRAGRARDVAVQFARGEQLVFLDSDILLPPDFMREVSQLATQYDIIQLTRQMVKRKPLSELSYANINPSDLYRESPYWEDFKRADEWPSLRNFWKYTCTYCLVMSRENYERAGGFKHSFSTYGFEDVDVGYRLAQLGRKFHLSRMPAYHLFPIPTDHSTHFEPKRRQRALATSCRRFYFMNLDPDIYRDLYTILNPPTSPIFQSLRWMGRVSRKLVSSLRWRLWPQTAS